MPKRPRKTPPSIHGKAWAYDDGCRCRRCTDAKLKYNARWRKKNPNLVREHKRRDSAKRKARPIAVRRNEWLRWRYGITSTDYDRMLQEQQYCCPVCLRPLGSKHWERAVDHDHATGVVRGILCEKCNHGLGAFQDDPHRMRRAADFVDLHRQRTP